MTRVNRFHRWTEAMPTTNVTDEITRKAIIHNLIPHFDYQVTVTTDQVKPHLSHPYTSLHPIISWKEGIYLTNFTVSINRIKPTYGLSESPPSTPTSTYTPEDEPSSKDHFFVKILQNQLPHVVDDMSIFLRN
ncbi:hypothetical protein NPIL_677951 [Nephila pilipes]|uniref:Uncharacterized protein n=1 Tax=Nephila pilipes TaxID=299642 RepID=A0A8X6U1K9_NEPPI|nr:hypothetical protein NPIL_677951 [Nephila pilipes]